MQDSCVCGLLGRPCHCSNFDNIITSDNDIRDDISGYYPSPELPILDTSFLELNWEGGGGSDLRTASASPAFSFGSASGWSHPAGTESPQLETSMYTAGLLTPSPSLQQYQEPYPEPYQETYPEPYQQTYPETYQEPYTQQPHFVQQSHQQQHHFDQQPHQQQHHFVQQYHQQQPHYVPQHHQHAQQQQQPNMVGFDGPLGGYGHPMPTYAAASTPMTRTSSSEVAGGSAGWQTPARGHSSAGEESPQYPCTHDGCKKTFSRPSDLAKHKRYHVKDLFCPLPNCNKAFSVQKDLDRHRTTHEPSEEGVRRGWACNMPGCRKARNRHVVNRRDNFIRHFQKAHKGVKFDADDYWGEWVIRGDGLMVRREDGD